MSDELINGIYVSIKQEPTSKIVQGIKNHEFRNYIPKKSFKFMYVYVTAPQSQLKYVIEIGNILQYFHSEFFLYLIYHNKNNIFFHNKINYESKEIHFQFVYLNFVFQKP